ncbi:MAG: sulfatase family protein [Planctomycetota bacterium]|jgi:arylsulfatase A-like enzyme
MTKPNLLFIFTDEQRFDTMACYGNNKIRTPNFNALADESFIFENAYVTQSVCTPSRSTIMTGLYPHSNGCVANNIPLNKNTRTIAEIVSEDYKCAYYGKWHLWFSRLAEH